jgi:hypothetical protein
LLAILSEAKSFRGKTSDHADILEANHRNGTSSEQKIETKFKAAQAKAKRDGVDALTKEDIEGLSPGQLKQIRGY